MIFLAVFVALSMLISACSSTTEIALSEQEQLGQRMFVQNCAACHAQSGELVIVGPSLAGIGQRAENRVPNQDGRSYIENSILNPADYINEGYTNLMPPTFGDTLTDEQLDALIAYLYVLE